MFKKGLKIWDWNALAASNSQLFDFDSTKFPGCFLTKIRRFLTVVAIFKEITTSPRVARARDLTKKVSY